MSSIRRRKQKKPRVEGNESMSSIRRTKRKKPRVEGNESIMPEKCLVPVLYWLSAIDLATCSQVCQQWNREINSGDGEYWKNAIMESPSRKAFQRFEAAMQGQRKGLDYRTLAKGFAINTKIDTKADTKVGTKPPSIKAEDIFVTLELKGPGMEESFCQNLGTYKGNFGSSFEAKISFLACTPETQSTWTFEVPDVEKEAFLRDMEDCSNMRAAHAHYVAKYTRAKLIIWRRDTGQTVRYHIDEKQSSQIAPFVHCMFHRSQKLGDNHFRFPPSLFLKLQPVSNMIPAANMTIEEAKERMYFHYEMNRVDLNFEFVDDIDRPIKTREGALSFLERLDWK